MVIVTALPAQAAVQAATLNKRTVSAVSTYTGTNAALTANKTTAKKAALNKTSLKLKKGKTYQLKTKNVKGTVTWKSSNKKIATVSKKGKVLLKRQALLSLKLPIKRTEKQRL